MNRQRWGRVHVDARASVRGVAARGVAAVAAAALAVQLFSCLPSSDLSGYSNGTLPSEPEGIPLDGVLPEGASEELSRPDLGADGEGSGSPEATAGSDCAGECPVPVLLGSEGQGGTLGSGSPDEGSQNEGPPNQGGPAAPADTPDGAPASCVSDASLGPNQRCFALVSSARSWQDARTGCRGRGNGWDLATIRNTEQNSWLLPLLGTLADAWLGASDLQSEGAWRWVGDGAAFWNGPGGTGSRVANAYVNWNDGPPNPEPNGGEASDCLRLRSGGGWADFECNTALASICEGPKL